MARLYTFAFLFLLSGLTYAQTETAQPEPIATDRPDQTETPAIVPKGMFQMESGFSFEKENSDSETFVTPSVLWKYGVNENFELRLITEFSSNKTNGETVSGLNPILIGFKVSLLEEKGIVPETSFIGHLLLPNLASKELKADYYATEFRFTMQHTLTKTINLGYNLGAEWDGMTPDATFIYTLTTGFSLSEKWGAYTEVYGFAPQNETAYHSFDCGLTYLVSNNVLFDVSGGVGLTEFAPDYFAAIGFSFRI